MSEETKKPWWWPQLTDAAWCAQLREEGYEGTADATDEELREDFADGNKYSTTWDHTGDAYAQFEALADAFFDLQRELAAAKAALAESVPKSAVAAEAAAADELAQMECREAVADTHRNYARWMRSFLSTTYFPVRVVPVEALLADYEGESREYMAAALERHALTVYLPEKEASLRSSPVTR